MQLPANSFSSAKAEAVDKISNIPFEIIGYDIDRKTVALAKENVKRAGFDGRIHIETADVKDLCLPGVKNNVIVCNPPYGERMSDRQAVREQTKLIGRVFAAQPNCRSYVISSSETFERDYEQKVRKKRKLYNGMIKTCLYQYFE
jgi:putative N6-adenine-specific DNA methylase